MGKNQAARAGNGRVGGKDLCRISLTKSNVLSTDSSAIGLSHAVVALADNARRFNVVSERVTGND